MHEEHNKKPDKRKISQDLGKGQDYDFFCFKNFSYLSNSDFFNTERAKQA